MQASAGLNLGVDFLPGALPFSPRRRPARPRAGRRRRLARRADRQRRPHAAQPQPAALARPHVADRPRRGAVSPSRRAPARTAFPTIAEHVLLPCAGSIAEADARLAARVDRGPARATWRGLVPDGVDVGARRAARLPGAAPGGAARLRARRRSVPAPGADAFQYAILRVVPRVERGERAERRRRAVLPPARVPRRARGARRRAAARARARARRRARCAGTSTRSCAVADGRPATAARSPRCRSPSASAGSSRRRARSSSRPPVHTGLARRPGARRWTQLFDELVA